MSLYRCAACGSPNVAKHEQNDGFSYKKAIAGTVVFGAVGAVAGINGKDTEVFACPDCGASLREPMDSITQAKIDSVMIDPETLVPMIFPDMYGRYAYLRKEIDQRRNRKNEETFSRLTTVSSVQQNPLNISEEEFRQSAKEVKEALWLLWLYWRYYEDHGMPNFESGELINEANKITANIKDIEFIYQSLCKMKNVVYSLSYYRNLIHDEISIDNGLSKHALRNLLFTYVMMELRECSGEELYYYIDGNEMLKQACMLVMNKKHYDDMVRRELRIWEMSHYSSEYKEKRMMVIWFGSLHTHNIPIVVETKIGDKSFLWDDVAKAGENEAYLRCRIHLSGNTLYILNSEDPEKLFEKASPELASQIKGKKEAVEQTQKRYDELEKDQPSTEEQNKARQISANQASIQELQKVRFFGKKKALAQAEALTKENERLKSQIEAMKATRIQENKKARDEIRKQLDTLKKELAELQVPMNDYVRSVRWLPVK